MSGGMRNLLSGGLPAAAAITAIVAAVGWAIGIGIWMGGISTTSQANAADIVGIKETIKDYPSRSEFNALTTSVNGLNNRIDNYFLNKK